jgi:hypothetical protein
VVEAYAARFAVQRVFSSMGSPMTLFDALSKSNRVEGIGEMNMQTERA